jgi:hypothetical protein
MARPEAADWAIAFKCNLMRVGLGDPRRSPQEVLLPQLLDETPTQRRTRAEIMGDNIRVGHPWAAIRFEAGLLKQPMATADVMIESLMRHYGDFGLPRCWNRPARLSNCAARSPACWSRGRGRL